MWEMGEGVRVRVFAYVGRPLQTSPQESFRFPLGDLKTWKMPFLWAEIRPQWLFILPTRQWVVISSHPVSSVLDRVLAHLTDAICEVMSLVRHFQHQRNVWGLR